MCHLPRAGIAEGIYTYFSSTFGTKPPPKAPKRQTKMKRHDRQLKKITDLKNEARKNVRMEKKEKKPPSVIAKLTGRFLSLLREHSRLKRISTHLIHTKNANYVRQKCHNNFWKLAKDLLDDNSASRINPQFSKDQATNYFSDTYSSNPQTFNHPTWMPTPPLPSYPFMNDPIMRQEIEHAIKNARSSSSPSPHDQISYTILKKCPSIDQISYTILKKCPSIVSALLDLYCYC